MADLFGVEAPDGYVYGPFDYQTALDTARDRHLSPDDDVIPWTGGEA